MLPSVLSRCLSLGVRASCRCCCVVERRGWVDKLVSKVVRQISHLDPQRPTRHLTLEYKQCDSKSGKRHKQRGITAALSPTPTSRKDPASAATNNSSDVQRTPNSFVQNHYTGASQHESAVTRKMIMMTPQPSPRRLLRQTSPALRSCAQPHRR
jgi:hypothetical protein